MKYVLETHNLSKNYGMKKVVNAVDMHVKKGDIYGFIGKNGAGKTTFMRMITGLARPTAGDIKLFESDDLITGRSRIGSMIEYPGIYMNMTAYENMKVFGELFGVVEEDAKTEILGIVGLNADDKKKVKNYSLGMKQRLGIAIALLGNPDMLILDEPINGLDPEGIKEVRDLLLRLNKENGVTILISSHILGELSKIATTYGIIKDGCLVEEFTKEELKNKCKRCIKLTVNDVNAAAKIVETKCNSTNYDVINQNTIRVFDMVDTPNIINRELINGGIDLYSSTVVGQDLEGYFIALMGGDNND